MTASALVAASAQQPCPRYTPGSTLTEAKELYSSHGKLTLNLTYLSRIDSDGNTLYCFMTDDGVQSPTLHVNPGDTLSISFKNALPPTQTSMSKHSMPGMIMTGSISNACGAVVMDNTSANIHYHGTNTSPSCHQDEVIRTLVNSGESFQYNLVFPADEPPGLYWYHPHVHGISETAVQGGASGALIVDGIEEVTPEVAKPARVMVIRDNPLPGSPAESPDVPAWDISLNYIPIPYPNYPPVVIPMSQRKRQFWRVANASADTILDLQLQYDGQPQNLQIVALDAVPIGSQDGTGHGHVLVQDHILLPPAARAEFIVVGPDPTVANTTLMTLNVDTGPDGDVDPSGRLHPFI